jgi:hypothetical protein
LHPFAAPASRFGAFRQFSHARHRIARSFETWGPRSYGNGNDEFVCHLNQGAVVESRMTAIPTAVRPESLIYEQLGDDLGVGDDFVREGIFSAVVGESEAGMVEAEGV